MKKLFYLSLILLLLLTTVCSFASCGNMQIIDTTYEYNYALVKFPDGTCEKLEIQSWCDYEGEQIQIVTPEGKVYLFNSVNCVLVKATD